MRKLNKESANGIFNERNKENYYQRSYEREIRSKETEKMSKERTNNREYTNGIFNEQNKGNKGKEKILSKKLGKRDRKQRKRENVERKDK